MKRFINRYKKVLDKFTGVKYDEDMLQQLNIPPKQFEKTRKQYEAALRARQQDILYLKNEKGWTQQKIADFYGVDITAVNRIIKKAERKEESEPSNPPE
jgi:Sigma-70, region 4.